MYCNQECGVTNPDASECKQCTILSQADRLNQQRFLLQEELYQAINLYDSLYHPNVIAISDEMDNVTMELQRMGVVA